MNPLKVRRFGKKVLGEAAYARGKGRLHDDLGEVLGALLKQGWIERRKHLYPVEEAVPKIIDALRDAGRLLATGPLTHSYPHCWRHKTR